MIYARLVIGSRFECSHNHELIEFWSPKKTYSIEQIFDKIELINNDGERITRSSHRIPRC